MCLHMRSEGGAATKAPALQMGYKEQATTFFFQKFNRNSSVGGYFARPMRTVPYYYVVSPNRVSTVKSPANPLKSFLRGGGQISSLSKFGPNSTPMLGNQSKFTPLSFGMHANVCNFFKKMLKNYVKKSHTFHRGELHLGLRRKN